MPLTEYTANFARRAARTRPVLTQEQLVLLRENWCCESCHLVIMSALPWLVRVVYRRMRNWPEHVIDDAMQEALVAVIMRAHFYDPAKGKPATFFSLVASRALTKFIDSEMRQRGRFRQFADDEGVRPYDVLDYRTQPEFDDEFTVLQEKFHLLSERNREIVMLLAAGRTMREVGEMYGLTKQAIDLVQKKCFAVLRGERPPLAKLNKEKQKVGKAV